MGQQVTLGGERLGSGKKMKVDTKSFNRSTHDQSRIFRSTMAAGTLVPFFIEYGLPGTTFDIDLQCYINTHPAIGPLFASAKVQLDVFQTPLRLYNSKLHNNALNVGRKMSDIKLPVIEMNAAPMPPPEEIPDLDNSQINPSSLLAYLGIRGIGYNNSLVSQTRQFNALGILTYWDIIKNYYANKQEEIGAVIHTPSAVLIETVDQIGIIDLTPSTQYFGQAPAADAVPAFPGYKITIEFTGTQPIPEQIILNTQENGDRPATFYATVWTLVTAGVLEGTYNRATPATFVNWRYTTIEDIYQGTPGISTFPLENIDLMREAILAADGAIPFTIGTPNLTPYIWLQEVNAEEKNNVLSTQEGLALKTYQSDLFNNWLKTENIEAISTQTGIDVSGGVLTIDQFIVSKKVWDMLNAINVSGGTYDDWQQVVYDHDSYKKCETPMYMGGLIKELIFQEVISNSDSNGQPLGTLAGKGTLSNKHKGGHIIIRCDEPSIIMGIVSITPRIDYSQGNEWHVHLKTMDDFHKPFMDGIGFQDLITEQMAWWSTIFNDPNWIQKSAGKQPAWLNYMTAINKTYGNFAIAENEMFMTFNRRYQHDDGGQPEIADLTTYIDPSKFNYIFAETQLDAQNYWTQISIDMTSRRKMSAKIMPHL